MFFLWVALGRHTAKFFSYLKDFQCAVVRTSKCGCPLTSLCSPLRYQQHSLALMEAYDPSRNMWLKLADMVSPCSGLGACSLFGLLYTVGVAQIPYCAYCFFFFLDLYFSFQNTSGAASRFIIPEKKPSTYLKETARLALCLQPLAENCSVLA